MSQIEIESRYGALKVRSRRGLSIRAREAIECYFFILPMLLGLLLFFIGPMVASFYFSLTEYDMLMQP